MENGKTETLGDRSIFTLINPEFYDLNDLFHDLIPMQRQVFNTGGCARNHRYQGANRMLESDRLNLQQLNQELGALLLPDQEDIVFYQFIYQVLSLLR